MPADPIHVISLEPSTAGTAELSRLAGRSGRIEVLCVPGTAEALQASLRLAPCVLLIPLSVGEDGRDRLDLVRRLEKNIRDGRVKALVISAFKGHPLAPDFAAAGITDFGEEPLATQALTLMMGGALRAVVLARQNARAAEMAEQKTPKEIPFDPLKGEVRARYVPALDLEEDIFAFRNTPPKKLGKKFFLQAEGPSPNTGEWVKHAPAEEESSWRWVPKKRHAGEADPTAQNGWISEGERPAFNEKTRRWQFRSFAPRLFYQRGADPIAEKVRFERPGNIYIAEDSERAAANIAASQAHATLIREQRKASREGKSSPDPALQDGDQAAAGQVAGEKSQSSSPSAGEKNTGGRPGIASEEAHRALEEDALNRALERKMRELARAGEEELASETEDPPPPEGVPAENIYFYLARAEVGAPEGGWEQAKRDWIFVPPTVYEAGFTVLDELLPAWLYQGSVAPEFEAVGDRWKFYLRPPVRISRVEELPSGTRNALLALRAQSCLLAGIDPDSMPATAKERDEKGPAAPGERPDQPGRSLFEKMTRMAESLPAASRAREIAGPPGTGESQFGGSPASPGNDSGSGEDYATLSLRVRAAELRRRRPGRESEDLALLILHACLPGWKSTPNVKSAINVTLAGGLGPFRLTPPPGRDELTPRERELLERTAAALLPILRRTA